jgi:hypothetical protein
MTSRQPVPFDAEGLAQLGQMATGYFPTTCTTGRRTLHVDGCEHIHVAPSQAQRDMCSATMGAESHGSEE